MKSGVLSGFERYSRLFAHNVCHLAWIIALSRVGMLCEFCIHTAFSLAVQNNIVDK